MRMRTLAALALGLAVAVATLSLASAQDPQEPPHTFYGGSGTAGEIVAAHSADGEKLGETTVAEDGSWYIDVDRDEAEGATFTVNGEAAEAEITNRGSGLDEVSLTVVVVEEDDSMMDEGDEDSMMEDGEMSEDEDSMMEDDSMEEDSMMDEDDSVMDDSDDQMSDNGYPSTGSGGLADSGGVSAGLIGLLIALGAAAIAGVGVRRVRNRA